MSHHTAIVTPERLSSGMNFPQFVASASANQEEFQRGYDSFSVAPEDAAFFAALPARHGGAITILALGEDWCPDVVTNLPIVARLAECSPQIHLRVFPRDANLDLMNLYLKDGQYQSIPTFVWYDAALNELGVWAERPAAANAVMAQLKAEMENLGLPPEEARRARRRRLDQEYGPRLRAETVREMREMLGGGATA